MKNPTMITICGHTFEKSAIEGWVNKNHTCPLCKEPVTVENLALNYQLKTVIQEYERRRHQ